MFPTQQGTVSEQVCPAPGHVAAAQVPTLAPPTLLHASPEQQSAAAVHAWPSGEHSCAGWQMFGPPSVEVQVPAQHSADAAHVVPFALQTPASGAGGSRHANPVLEAAQTVPAQQVVPAPPSAAAQPAPSAEHVGAMAQVSPLPPSELGRHGELPQH